MAMLSKNDEQSRKRDREWERLRMESEREVRHAVHDALQQSLITYTGDRECKATGKTQENRESNERKIEYMN